MRILRVVLFVLLSAILAYLFLAAITASAQVAVSPIINPHVQFFDSNGYPLSGGQVYTYAAGTTTLQASYKDSTGLNPNTNPIILDSGGFADIWISSQSYKLVVKSLFGVTQWTADNVTSQILSTIATMTVTGGPNTMNGQFTMTQGTAATASANQSGYKFCQNGSYWTGAASAADQWCWQDVLGAGANPTSTYTVSHTGSSGAATMSINGGFATCALNGGLYYVGSTCYPNIASARAAAGPNTIVIPQTYAGTDGVADSNISVLDLRHNMISSSHYFGCTFPVTGAPGGLDCAYESNGAGDLVLGHNAQVNPATTTSTSLIIGSNNNIAVSSTANFGNGGTGPLIVGRDTANEETVPSGNWAVVDATHMNITCTKTHSGTTDLMQLGMTVLDGGHGIIFQAHKPSQFTATDFPPIRWLDPVGIPFLFTPGHTGVAFPYGQILFADAADISGFSANTYRTAGNLNFRNASSSTAVKLKNSAGSVHANFQDQATGPFTFDNDLTPVTTGARKLGTSALPWSDLYVNSLHVKTSVDATYGGIKHGRVCPGCGINSATCTTAASSYATCTFTFSWPVAFPDALYTVAITAVSQSDACTASIGGWTASGVTIQIQTQRSTACTIPQFMVLAVHD
jgi:hypothetical protein